MGLQTDTRNQQGSPSQTKPFLRSAATALYFNDLSHMSCSRIIVMRCMCNHLCQKLASMERMGFQ